MLFLALKKVQMVKNTSPQVPNTNKSLTRNKTPHPPPPLNTIWKTLDSVLILFNQQTLPLTFSHTYNEANLHYAFKKICKLK